MADLREWYRVLDVQQFAAMRDIKGWTIVALFTLCGALLCSTVPGISDFFQTDLLPVFLFWLLMIGLAALDGSSWVHERLGETGKALLFITVSFGLQLQLWSLVVFSTVPGGTVLVAFPILLASYHGQHFQVSLRYPYGALATLMAILVVALFDTDFSHLPLIAIGGLLSIGAAGVMGDNERRKQVTAKEPTALREALDAQILMEKSSEYETVQSALRELRGANHDAANAMSSILMNVQYLAKNARKADGGSPLSERIAESANDLNQAATQLRNIVEKGRRIGAEGDPLERVEVESVLKQVVQDMQLAFPDVDIVSQVGETQAVLWLPNGQTTLHRILMNLVKNACEGNGRSHAHRVEIPIQVNDSATTICITDNGPGFSPEQLTQHTTSLETTKTDGTGLGLYTTQRLATACGATMEIANNPSGGATVALSFPGERD